MKVSELIKELEKAKAEYGDLECVVEIQLNYGDHRKFCSVEFLGVLENWCDKEKAILIR